MSNLMINDLPKNEQLDQQALANFNGGIRYTSLLAQIKAEAGGSAGEVLNQEPELGVSPTLGSFASPVDKLFRS